MLKYNATDILFVLNQSVHPQNPSYIEVIGDILENKEEYKELLHEDFRLFRAIISENIPSVRVKGLSDEELRLYDHHFLCVELLPIMDFNWVSQKGDNIFQCALENYDCDAFEIFINHFVENKVPFSCALGEMDSGLSKNLYGLMVQLDMKNIRVLEFIEDTISLDEAAKYIQATAKSDMNVLDCEGDNLARHYKNKYKGLEEIGNNIERLLYILQDDVFLPQNNRMGEYTNRLEGAIMEVEGFLLRRTELGLLEGNNETLTIRKSLKI